jgi:hypothetical protein
MADRYFVNGGVDNNWGTTGNWSTSSGGAGGSSVPSTSDNVFLDINSPNCTVNSSDRNCLGINFTGYTNTITFSVNLFVNGGNVTLSNTSTLAGSSYLWIVGSCTFTSNGKTVNTALKFTGNITVTLADNMVVTGEFNCSQFGQFATFNGNQISIGGTLTINSGGTAGTTTFLYNGTGTWSGSGKIGNSFTINTAGTLTISGSVGFDTGTLTYTAGTVVTTGSTLTIGTTATLNVNGINWNNISVGSGNFTITLSSNLLVSGTLQITGFGQTKTINGFVVTLAGSLTLTNAITVTGTTDFIFNGTGTWSRDNDSAKFNNDVEINTAGTITFTGITGRSSGTLTLTAGTLAGSLSGTIGGGGSGTPFAYGFMS